MSTTPRGGLPCWNAFVINSLAMIPSFCAVAASKATGSASTTIGTGAPSAIPRKSAPCRRRRLGDSVSSRCTVAIDRIRAAVSSNARPSPPSGRPSRSRSATVCRSFLIRWLASCASVCSRSARAAARPCAATSARIVCTRTSAAPTAAASSASRIAVAPADSGTSAATTRHVAALTASQSPRRQPICTTAMNGTARKRSSAKLEPPSTTSSATNAINPPLHTSSKIRPRREVSQLCQGTTIATVFATAAARVRPSSNDRWRAPTSSATPATTATIETQPSQSPTRTVASWNPRTRRGTSGKVRSQPTPRATDEMVTVRHTGFGALRFAGSRRPSFACGMSPRAG